MNGRVVKLQQALDRYKIDAVLINRPENRRYLSGFTGTSGILLIEKNSAYIFTDFRYVEQVKEQSPHFQLVQISNDFIQKLKNILLDLKIQSLGFEADFVTFENYDRMSRELSGVELIPVKNMVEELRIIKDPEELQLIQKAVDIADRAWSETLKYVKPGISELELSLKLEYTMRRLGAEGRAFDFIVASGKRGALPHGVASEKKLKDGELVTVDCGAVYKGYHSDMTRNFVLGQPAEMHKKIYNIVLEAQKAGIEAVRPGIYASEVDKAAREVIERYGYGENFGHGTGHGVGLAIHESPRVSYSEQVILKPGMVITIEPGIYLPGWGGIRIEDVVLVTENGYRILTKSPKEELLII
ncbi:MAG: aminopeptidase P family protein [Desulfotomaculum sp.]|nr:aminopeptidase P family protein [Desulfotomaculum sp.]